MNERNIIIVAFVLIIGLAFFGSNNSLSGYYVSAPQTCEVLGSLSIYEPHSVVYDSDPNDGIIGKTYESTCSSSATLSSVRCRNGKSPETYNVICPPGYGCSNGACVETSFETEDTNCIDSDGGADIYEKGVTAVLNGRARGIPEQGMDVCATNTAVTEYTCHPGGKDLIRQVLQCPYPKTCSDGACV